MPSLKQRESNELDQASFWQVASIEAWTRLFEDVRVEDESINE